MTAKLISTQHGTAEYQLSTHHPLRLRRGAGQRIECLSGMAWITAAGQNTDFILRAGQSLHIPTDGLVLLEAVGTDRTRVRIPLPGPLSGLARLAALLRRQAFVPARPVPLR